MYSYFDVRWRLSACRVQVGYSQVEVARLMGVQKSTISNWETGRTHPTMKNAKKLSELYRIPLAYMDWSKEGNATPLKDREILTGI